LRREWIGPPDFDHWFKAQFNNARLSAMATYDDYVPAFAEMLNRHDGDLEAFYAQVTALAQLDSTERTGRLLALAGNP
jgi:predicted aminopeptidase